ncbi:E3 SUMO-protein ligase RanBP2-like [Ixodes scapularis]
MASSITRVVQVLFEERAKLFRFVDKEWKERGIGVLKLLENQEGKVRLLMRREQVLKVCANHNMHPSMTLTPMPNKDTAWIWDAQDFADGEPRPEKFCVRFKTPEIASRFKDAFEQAVQKSKRPRAPSSSSSVSGGGAISSPSPAAAAFSPPFSAGASFGSPKSTFGSVMAASAVSALSFGSPVAATVVASGSPPTSLPSLPATGFGKMFHPKPGAWSCHVCYVSNEANKLTCAACDSPKPDYVSNEASKPTGSTTDSQQPGAGKPKTALVQASGTKPGTSLFGEIAASKTPTASPAWTTFGAIATSKASSAPPGQSVFGAIATSKALPTSPAQSVSGDVAAGKALPASPALSVFGAIATSKASSAVPAQSVFGDVATSKASPTPPAQSVFGAIATSKASSAVPAQSVFGDVTTSKASPTPPAQSVFGQIATSQASTASPSSSVFGDIAKSKASSGATAPSLFGGCATTKVPPTVATSAHVFTFGVTMPDQKPAASASPFGGSSSGANVFGGFTFSSPPKVKEAPKEESKATPAAATTKGEAAKPSPFASFSFQSPTKKEEPKEAAASPFVMGARSEISKLSLTPPAAPSAVSLPNLAKSALGKAAPPAPAKTPRSPQEVPEEFVPNVEFEPVVPLPELVEAKTGEEDEEVLFCQRAKLYRYDGETKQWKERGVGQLKILRHGETGACRVLMRRDQVLKLCANHRILPEMKLGPLATGDRAWSWFAKDYSEGELNSEQLAVRFKTRELAEQFRQVFESCRDEAVQVVPAKAEVAQEAKTEESVQQQSVPLSQLSQFRPKQGTWSCETCYVENPTERAVCVACETPRPGAAQPGPGAPSPLAALEKFASPVVGNTGFPVGPSATTPAKFSFGFPSAGAATASSQGGASSKAPGFVFGCGTQQFGGSAPPSTFTFGAAVSSANAPSSSEESSQAPGAFKFGSPQKYEFSFSGVRPRSPGKTPKSPGTPTDAEEEDAGGWTESPEADIYFQPVVPLPPKVAVKTGEEEEELLYSHRAKLYRWLDGEWKERGLGDIKLLFDPAAKRVRLLMRREPVLKVCLNHLLSRELQLTKKDDKVVLWSATDFSDGEPSPHQFALRLKTPQLADEFLAAVEAAKARLDAPPESAAMAASKPASRVDASTFSFRLDDTPKEAASPATPPAAAASFSLASRFGGSRQSVVRSLFGNTSPAKTDSDDVISIAGNMVRVFASLQRETLNQRGGTPESLSQMDTDAFVEATQWCAAQALSQGRRIPGPLSLPPHVGVPLCTQAQAGWWSAAHQLHTNSAGEQLPELRRVLQRGLEVIRGIGNHGLDLPLVVHLARTFAVRSSSKREQCQDEDVCLSLEGRAALYWQLALSLLEAGSGPFASPRGPSRRLFGPSPLTTPLSSAEERALREEACMFLAVRAMNAECLEEAAEMLADLRSAEAALYTALVLKRLSQQKAGDPGMQQALLTRARNSLLLSLERGQREALNQDLTLQVRQQLEDLEALLAEANLSNGSLEEQVGSPRRGLSTSQFRNSTQSSSTPRPDRRFFETRTEADMTNIGSESVTDTPPRSRTRQAARDAAGSYGTDLTEVMLRSLSLHQDIVVRSLGQMQETNRQILTEMREIGKAMATEAKQRETLMEQLVKKLEDATTRATAARSQRHREDSEYVDDYVGNYEAEYDAYADYSHPEAGGGASPLVAAPAPLPLGYPPYRGQPYGGFPAAPLGYPLVPPPPPMGRPLAPPPPQAFYSPQAAAAAAAVATPGLRLAEGQPLPHFTFDISQPPPPPVPSMMPAGRLPAPPVPPPSAFSRLGPLPPPPAPTLTPPKPPNAPHAFQIPLPPTASAGQSPSFLGNAATAATAPAPASTTPQLEGLLRKGPAGGPPPASLVPEKQAPTTPVGSKTGEQAATPSPGVARRGSQRLSTGSDDYLEEAEVEGNFKPLIPLPEEVSVCTGEENEKDNMLWFQLFIVTSF